MCEVMRKLFEFVVQTDFDSFMNFQDEILTSNESFFSPLTVFHSVVRYSLLS